MGKHRKPAAKKKWAPYVTTGVALEAAALLTFAYAVDNHVTPTSLLAATTSIFIDGTKPITGSETGISPYRMVGALDGEYDQSSVDPANNEFIVYPRSLGPLTGVGDPTYDASEGDATAKTVAAVKAARDANGPDATIYVVGYSQGAGAASQAITALEHEGYSTNNVDFVLAADPRRNDGGILTRFPAGAYVPIIGVTFGDGTSPQNPNTKVLQVTKQYDGVADTPVFFLNVVADANAALGFYYLHPGFYANVDPSTVPADDRIISTSADGSITDVLIKAPVGELPLTMPLLQLGIPKPIVAAFDPFLRAVIETGYNRPDGPGSYPSEPVPFQLAPPPATLITDVQSVTSGAVKSTEALAGVAQASAPPVPLALTAKTPAPTAQTVTSPTPAAAGSPNRFTPPHQSTGGWKPGDLIRSFLKPIAALGSLPSTKSAGAPASTPSP